VSLRHVGHAFPRVSMKFLAGCVLAVVSLSVGGVIEARSTASEPVRRRPAVAAKGKLGAAIRQLREAAPCTPSGIVGTVLDGNA
jgi:hypothetical protein